MSTTESGLNIEGDWAGTCVFDNDEGDLTPTALELSLISPAQGQGRFIGEVENAGLKSHALICGSQAGRTLRFSGIFRGDAVKQPESYAEFIAMVSDDGLVLRGTLRQQVHTTDAPIRLAQGSWHARRVTPMPDNQIAEMANSFALAHPASSK